MPDGAAAESELPLFPLGLVALPDELIPLHIFEPRYLTMIGECLETGGEFGIVLSDGEGLRDVGCAAEVTEVLERMDDGRLNIAVRGTRPFRLVARLDDRPYPAGVVEFLGDRAEEPDAVAAAEAHAAFAELVEQATDEVPEPEDIEPLRAYEMAGRVEFGLAAKQGMLGLRSENARLRLLARLLRAALKRLELVEQASERAQSNGKVRFGPG